MFEKAYDFRQPFNALRVCDETAIYSDDQRGDSHTARAGRDEAIVARNIFASHPRVRVSALPVVVKTGFLQHREQFIVAEFAGGGAGGLRQWRRTILPVRSSHFVLRCDSRLTEEVRVAIRSRQLNAHRFEVFAVERAIDHVASECGAVDRVPTNFDVPVITDSTDIFGSGPAGAGCGWIVIDTNLIDDERVLRAISVALMKNNVLYELRPKFIDRSRMELGERDSHLDPLSRRNVSGNFPQWQRLRKSSGELRDLQPFRCVGEDQHRKVGGGDSLRGKAPEVEVAPLKFGKAIAVAVDPDFRFPASTPLRLPPQPEGIGRRKKSLCLNRQAPADQFQSTGTVGRTLTVEVRVRRQTIVEEDVTIIFGVAPGDGGKAEESQ